MTLERPQTRLWRFGRKNPRLGHAVLVARRGVILLVVLIVIALLSLAGYTFAELMFAENEAVVAHGRGVQARALSDSGLAMLQVFLEQDQQTLQDAGGWYDNPTTLQGVLVVDEGVPGGIGRFTVISPRVEGGMTAGVRYGLEDESGRLNLNYLLTLEQQQSGLGRTLLMTLPGMTDEVADSILDWLDPDDEPREFGAENEVYSGLDPPYACKNGPLDSVEELLLVQGVTPAMLFGPDANRNGLIDVHEQAAVLPDGVDNSDGSFDRGWSGYLTLYSREGNVTSDGKPRVNINGSDMKQLYADLVAAVGQEWATFIVAYRQNGAYSGSTVGAVPAGGRALDLTVAGGTSLKSVLDLIGTAVSVKFQGEQQALVITSPFTSNPAAMGAYLPKLMEQLTLSSGTTIAGRINVNQAPRALLMGIPGMTEQIVDAIVSLRISDPAAAQPGRNYATWLLSEGIVPLATMKTLLPYVTGNGGAWRAQVLGYFDGGGSVSRMEAVLDTTNGATRLLLWRDLSHLGRGYPLDTLGVGN